MINAMQENFDISTLSLDECRMLAMRLLERVAQEEEAISIPPEHMAELERRLEMFDRGEMPPAKSWEEVKAYLDTL